MRIICPHCQEVVEVDDSDVRSYVSSLNGKIKSKARADASRANSKKPRPGRRKTKAAPAKGESHEKA